jgi:predicted alpha-1,2-mannosidase
MPTTGKILTVPGSRENPDLGYRSRFKHKTEIAFPGYYSVLLDDYKIRAEITSSARVGMHRYTFPKTSEANIIIDPFHGYATDSIIATSISILNDSTIVGSKESRGWGEGKELYWCHHSVYFAAVFSKKISSAGLVKEGKQIQDKHSEGRNLKVFARFKTKANEAVMIKVGISAVDINGAINNLNAEIAGWDFDSVVSQSGDEWNQLLSAVMVQSTDTSSMKTFYTAIYHSMLAPYLYSDADGRYRGFDGEIYKADGFKDYTVFSLWDVFRAEIPLFTIMQPERVNDMIRSFLAQYKQSGLLPVWPLDASETNCMIGYHSVPVIVDAYMKGIRNFDIEEAYKAMKKSAMQDSFGIDLLKKYKFIPSDLGNKSVSRTLEYAYDDWCIAQIARELKHKDDYTYFSKRARAYALLYDPKTGLMRGKDHNGKFVEPFDPTFASYGYSDFIEGNSWQYSFFAPQDIPGLIKLMGGNDKFINKLDELFTVKTSASEGKPLDVSGLIGEYAHGNEPSHHVAYLYAEAGAPSKTQSRVRDIMKSLYNDSHEGLCGNEDCGQMSAWYIFSALGFYPVNPASGIYTIGSPLFSEVKINLPTGRNLIITAHNQSPENVYIQSAKWNGHALITPYVKHSDLMNGGELVFEMSPKPSNFWSRR